MARLAKFDIPYVLPHLARPNTHLESQNVWDIQLGEKRIRLFTGRSRYQLIKKTQVCACCGLQGSFFTVESGRNHAPHLRLYGIGRYNKHIIMTLDHIIPKSQGGRREPDNSQMLCKICNTIKDNDVLSIEELQHKISLPKYKKMTRFLHIGLMPKSARV